MRAPCSNVVATTTTANQHPPTSALKSRTLSSSLSVRQATATGKQTDSGAASTPRPMTTVAIFPVHLPASLPLASTEHTGHLLQQTSITRLRQTAFAAKPGL